MSCGPSDIDLKMKKKQSDYEACIDVALKAAKRLGAHEAEVSLSESAGLSVAVRNHEIETLEYDQNKTMVITVYLEQCKGSASTSDFSTKAIKEAVCVALEIARFTSKDEFSGLPLSEDLAWDYPDLDLYHPWKLKVNTASDLALACEVAALKCDKRITNSEGVTLSSHQSMRLYGNSHGFVGCYPSSTHSLSCSVIASENGRMQRDSWYTISRDAEFLETPQKVGRIAAKRALARLNARQIPTAKYPVLFSPAMSAGLMAHFISAINGNAIYRNASFLLDALDTVIFPEWMHIYEQPHMIGALGSVPFDAEGVKTSSRNIVDAGRLQTYVLNSYSARKLKMKTTGNAGGVHNLHVEPGKNNFNAMLKEMHQGLFVTELMGQGINTVTGDYSRGASGFWVENGKIQYPVEEITIAGNLKNMFRQIVAVGNDIDLRYATRTGSILLEEMMIAGQ